ncbi:aminopeptidase P family protein [Corynebacterium sp. 320]|uniref:M24 family metallopeptidase n=1 Tax=Corynebacterium TaxID=1716 RepID=UPI00125CCE48|nr:MULTISPECIES: aminopeptidase P family protein [Corynebacterium]KAB1503704.1 aminopeptidase P family protein [Corynebacterium sp. 320]KAB1553195.1 aminopeptidase P family protein [Corynebacterium sp. 321]KAB1553586.1 aminopeptidase P family protein [Corynebacterium sp. 319]KAB3527840.1 aminopeptidase P family protein [Corynebacterium sp. 250]KAB3540671.1 aminopeptidase P family protein [Corynebacterium sp. 366]
MTSHTIDFASRRQRVAQRISDAGHGALLVTDLKNIRYLTGFSGSHAVLLLRADASAIIATDGRYSTQIKLQTGEPEDVDIRIVSDAFGEVIGAGDKFAVEPGLTVGQAARIGDMSSLSVLTNAVEDERLIKDEAEVQALLEAGRLADTVWQEFLADGGIQAEMREIDAAADLEHRLRLAGADALSFDTILASGINGAKPHAGVSQDVIVPGLVTVDFGVYLNGYASDQTRTVCVGQPNDLAAELYDIVYRSQKAGEEALAPGVALRDVDRACRAVIEEAGYGDFFVHSTGHGVGLDVHEAPRAASGVPEDSVLKPGMTITVEPGIYLPGQTGLRIENTYIITEEGAVSCQASPTELTVIDVIE